MIFSGALIDQSPGAHHPQTAFEALSHLKQFKVNNVIDLSKTSIQDENTTMASSSSTVNQPMIEQEIYQNYSTLDVVNQEQPLKYEAIELN